MYFDCCLLKQHHLFLGVLAVIWDLILFCYRSVYTYCESGKDRPDGTVDFEHKDYCPVNLLLQEIATHIKAQVWLNFLSLFVFSFFFS